MDGQLLKAAQVQQRYDISERTLYRWVAAGAFPKPITIGVGMKRWAASDLAEYDRSLQNGKA
jgi:predicted DNA-binding transcriptional regulator AlpA